MHTLAENVAHNLCNTNNTAPSIGIIRVTIYAANGNVSHIRYHRSEIHNFLYIKLTNIDIDL
jgi:hypothetical protein